MIVRTYIEFQEAMNWLDKQHTVAYDLETTGLEPRRNEVIGIAISNETESFYIVHQHLNITTKEYDSYIGKEQCRKLIDKLKTKKLITWNGSFDVRFTRHYFGIDLAPSIWCEGMLTKHTVDENRPFALKDVAKLLYGAEAAQEQADLLESIIANGGSAGQVWLGDLELVGKYACQDALLTYKINKHYLAEVEQQGLTKFYFEDEVIPLYKTVTIDMEDRGIKLDMDLLEQSKLNITEDIDILAKQLRALIAPHMKIFRSWYLDKTVKVSRSGGFAQEAAKFYNIQGLDMTKTGNFSFSEKSLAKLADCSFKQFLLGETRLPAEDVVAIQSRIVKDEESFNLNSKDHWKIIFFDTLNCTPLSRTEVKQDPQMDDEFLESVKWQFDFVPLLLDYNKLNKIKSTYIERFLDEQIDGRFYPSFMQHTTISGRFSGDLQQLNRPISEQDLKDGKVSEFVYRYTNIVREFFIADDGCVFIDADYESLEPHIFAHVSGDEGLKSIFREGKDFYSTISIMTENLTGVSAYKKDDNYLGKLNPSKRQAAKTYSLGAPYGQSGYALSKTLQIPVPEGERLLAQYMDAFPALAEWMEQSKRQVLHRGFVKIESGRIRHMPEAPNIYKAWGPMILDPLRVYEKWGHVPDKYKQMKFVHSKIKNYVNNSRNVQIQGLAASITNRASVAINKAFVDRGWYGGVVAQIHDQILTSVKQEYAEEARALVQQLMQDTYKISIPLKAPAKIANNFRDGH